MARPRRCPRRGAHRAPRNGRALEPSLDRRAPRQRQLRRHRGGRSAHRRDGAPALAARGGPVVARADLSDPAAGDADRRPSPAPGYGRARPGRQRVRRRRGALPSPRPHAAASRRPGEELDPACAEPREDGHQGGAALLHVFPPLWLPDRPRRFESSAARGRGRLLRGVAGGTAALSAARRGVVRAGARALGPLFRSRGPRARDAAEAWKGALRRRGSGALLLPRPSVPGAPRERRLRAHARSAVHVEGAGQAAAERGRARPAGRLVAAKPGIAACPCRSPRERRKVRGEHAPGRLRGTRPRLGEKDMATTSELEARIKELEARLSEMEEERSRWRARALMDELFPQESRKHMREAWKHNLLAVRSVLDHWIEKQDSNGKTGTKRRESISVE